MQKNVAIGVVVALAVVAVLAFVGMQYGYFVGNVGGGQPTTPPPTTPPASGGPVHLWTVNMTSAGFEPSTLTINKGDTVAFVNVDTAPHHPASAVHPTHAVYPEPGGCVGSKFDACGNVEPGQNFTFTFDYAGSWKYHDHLNLAHYGTIVVQERGGQY